MQQEDCLVQNVEGTKTATRNMWLVVISYLKHCLLWFLFDKSLTLSLMVKVIYDLDFLWRITQNCLVAYHSPSQLYNWSTLDPRQIILNCLFNYCVSHVVVKPFENYILAKPKSNLKTGSADFRHRSWCPASHVIYLADSLVPRSWQGILLKLTKSYTSQAIRIRVNSNC